LVDTKTLVDAADAHADHDETDVDNSTAATPACDTDNDAEAPPAETVTVPDRAEPVFAETDTVNVPPLTPEDGDTVNHD